MSTKAPLRVIEAPPEPELQPPIDLYTSWRAEIRERDWARVHIAGDRRAPCFLPDRVRRLWRR